MRQLWRGERVGSIEVICGPMFSGKTEELIRRLRRAQIAKMAVLVVKPMIDDRYDQIQIVSHSAQKLHSVPVKNVSEIKELVTEKAYDVIGIDEAQFLEGDLVELCEELAGWGIRVLVAGLDQDYLGRPFGLMPRLLAIADDVAKQHAVCMVCGFAATKSQRVATRESVANLRQVVVGAAESYEARCRRCFVRGIDKPAMGEQDQEADSTVVEAMCE